MDKFKIGDKVRRIGGDNNYSWKGGSSAVCEGEVYTVSGLSGYWIILKEHPNCAGSDPRFFELVASAEPELEELVKKANDATRVFQTLKTKYKGRVEFGMLSGSKTPVEQIFHSSTPSLMSNPDGDVFHIKPKPAFEPFYVGPGGPTFDGSNERGQWLVKLEGDTLHVGCKQFKASEAKYVLSQMCRHHRTGGDLSLDVKATREGLYVGIYHISWADADRILAALEKAGVK